MKPRKLNILFDDYAQSGFTIDPRWIEHWSRVYNIQTTEK